MSKEWKNIATNAMEEYSSDPKEKERQKRKSYAFGVKVKEMPVDKAKYGYFKSYQKNKKESAE